MLKEFSIKRKTAKLVDTDFGMNLTDKQIEENLAILKEISM